MFTDSDSFDSRGLRYTDCYGQRFMKTGTYAYNVMATGGDVLNDERPYFVTVRDRVSDTRMTQRTVQLTWDGSHFEPDERQVEVEAGDLVLWNCPQRLAPPYAVVGDKRFFSSSRLMTECGYSHAFGAPGTYEWSDALGKGAGGVVVVTDPRTDTDAELTRWKKALATGSLVMISNGKADPEQVEILTGQTVFFAVVTGPVTVTDRRLLDSEQPGQRPQRPEATKRTAKTGRGRPQKGASRSAS